MKKDKSFFSWLFAVIVLSVLLAISVYLGVSGWYFKSETSQVTDFKLGENIEIETSKNSASAVSLNFSGAFLSGEKLKQVVAIKNYEQEYEFYVRAKAYVYTSANEFQPISLVTSQNWVFNDQDGYYYFKDTLPAQNKISLCSQVYLDESLTLSSAKTYLITFVVETLTVDHTIEAFWGYNFIE